MKDLWGMTETVLSRIERVNKSESSDGRRMKVCEKIFMTKYLLYRRKNYKDEILI